MKRLLCTLVILYIFQSCATEYSKTKVVSNMERYINEGKFERAYQEFKSVIDDNCEDIELHKEFIKFVSRVHRCDEALKYYESYKFRDERLKYIYFYARALLGVSCFLKDRDEILSDFREALKLTPENPEIRMRYAVVLTEYEMYEDALEEFNNLKSSESPFLLSYIAYCAAHLGNSELVRGSVKRMLSLNFSDQDLKRASQALELVNSSCLEVPEDIMEDFRRIFEMVLVEDRPTVAKNLVENLLLKYPNLPSLHLLKALSLSLIGEYSSALYELNSVEGIGDYCSYFKYASGIVYLGVQKEEKGILFLEKAIELDPLLINPYRILSEVYLSKKEYKKVADLLKIYLRLKSDDHKMRFVYGKSLLKLGRIKEAKAEFDYIIDKEPDNVLGIVGRGLVEKAYAMGTADRKKSAEHMSKALKYINDAMQRDPDNENIKNLIKSINNEED